VTTRPDTVLTDGTKPSEVADLLERATTEEERS